MKKVLLATAVATACVAPSVFAQANNFEGFNVQLSTGYQSTSPKFSDQKLNNGTPDGTSSVSSLNGVPLYLGAGYTYAFSNSFTLGGLIEYNPINSGKSSINSYDNAGVLQSNGSDKNWVKSNTTLSIMPGYALNADTQIYAKLGYTWITTSCSNGNGSACSDSNETGYNTGLGLKKLIDKNIFVFGEANYITINSKTYNYNDNSGSYKTSGNAYNLLVGAGYKF